MLVYKPRRVTGGFLGKTYRSVAKTAKMFARSKAGKALGDATKRKVLEAGTKVVNKILSEESPMTAIKAGATTLANQLPEAAKKKFKRSILKTRKKTKLGGVALDKRRFKLKQKGVTLDKRRFKLRQRWPQKQGQILYKLNKRRGLKKLPILYRVNKGRGKTRTRNSGRKRRSVVKKRSRVKRKVKSRRRKVPRQKRRRLTRVTRKAKKRKAKRTKRLRVTRKRKSAKRIKSVFDL